MSDALTLNELTGLIAEDVKALLKLPDGSHIDVKFTANGKKPEAGGEINIKFSLPTTKKLTGAQESTSKIEDDAVLLVSALRDANEKMKRHFISLTWFRDKYLPALGIKLERIEWENLLTLLVARGEILLEQVVDSHTGRKVATVRTPDMPVPRDPKSEGV